MRDPVARNISWMFHNLNHTIKSNNYELPMDTKDTLQFINYIYFNHVNKEIPFVWFHEEFCKTTKINVFDFPFDKDKGYSLIERKNIKVLILTLEKLNENAEIIKKFTGIKNFRIEHYNDSKDKKYHKLYSLFKSNLALNKEKLDFYYENEVVKHFYSDTQIQLFRKKWSKNV